ncbi:MAG: PilZ domain-containing protein [Candidatus Sulfotelmatobacter sp.]
MSHEPDGSAYLAALRRGASTNSSDATAPARINDAAPLGDHALSNFNRGVFSNADKRRSPRYKCEASAEIREKGKDSRIWASCKDISMHGCYVETATTYPVGTLLTTRIDAQNFRIQAQAEVRVSYPHLGMGLAFTQMAEQDRTRLKEMLRTIASPSIIMRANHSL